MMLNATPPQPDAGVKTLLLNAYQEIKRLKGLVGKVSAQQEAIALCGIGCQFPGAGDDPQAYWQMLLDGAVARSRTDTRRWPAPELYGAKDAEQSCLYTRHAALLDDAAVYGFDADFFDMSAAEARDTDPQHRLLLQTVWHAIEDAGLDPASLAGQRVGIFVGCSPSDYARTNMSSGELERINAYAKLGVYPGFSAGRIAYVLGTHGPAIHLDTSCSSSLVALHLACQSLRLGECDIAIAAGVNLMLAAEESIGFCQLNALSPSGRCLPFDKDADGYVRGEGCGALVLQRASDVRAAATQPYALIRGSAINHDGASNGLTAPNGVAQQAVIELAQAAAGVGPADVRYVEAHGTGTRLGDPIEWAALAQVWRRAGVMQGGTLVGSVKANVGHLEAAAGMAGLIKLALMLKNGVIPPQAALVNPNPLIDWSNPSLGLATGTTALPSNRSERIVAISGFGMTGTNAHIVLQAWPGAQPEQASTPTLAAGQVFHLAASSCAALRRLIAVHAAHARRHETAAHVRSLFAPDASSVHRMALVAGRGANLAELLTAQLALHPPAPVVVDQGVVFMFSGQGAQYAGMGHSLYLRFPEFKKWIDACAHECDSALGGALGELLWGSRTALLQQTRYAQPALFCFEYALAKLWISLGVRPAALIGHSLGEICAAAVGGVMTLSDALRLVIERAERMQTAPGEGAMLAVACTEAQLLAMLPGFAGVSMAAHNGAEDVVASGPADMIAALTALCAERGLRCRPLQVSHGFHSSLMTGAAASVGQFAAGLRFQPPSLPLMSNVSATWHGADGDWAGYWENHMLACVRHADSVKAMVAGGYRRFLEIGPGATLALLGQREYHDPAISFLSCQASQDGGHEFLAAVAQLHRSGEALDFDTVNGVPGEQRVRLPRYPFEPQVHRNVPPQPGRQRATGRLLGEPCAIGSDSFLFAASVRERDLGVLRQHRVHAAVVVPAAELIDICLTAVRRVTPGAVPRMALSQLRIHRALRMPALGNCEVNVLLERAGAGWQVRLYSRCCGNASGPWSHHLDARVEAQAALLERIDAPAARQAARALPVQQLYAELAAKGLELGPQFRGIGAMRAGAANLLEVDIEAPDGVEDMDGAYTFPSHVLDACFQGMGIAVMAQGAGHLLLPVKIDLFCMYRKARGALRVLIRQHALAQSSTAMSFDIDIRDAQDRSVAAIRGLQLLEVSAAALGAAAPAAPCFTPCWMPAPDVAAPDSLVQPILVVGLDGAAVEQVGQLLGAHAAHLLRHQDGLLLSRPAHGTALPWRALAGQIAGARHVVFAHPLRPSAADPLAQDAGQAEAAVWTLTLLARICSAAAEGPQRHQLSLITGGAVALGPADAVSVSAAALWGAMAAVAKECPNLDCKLLDVTPDPAPAVLRAAFQAGPLMLAERDGRLHVPSFVPAAVSGAVPLAVAGATFIISGGTGALGQAIARWLAAHGAGKLILLSRTGKMPASAMADTLARSCSVHHMAVDLTDAAALEHALFGVERHTVGAVFHCAGALDDRLIGEQDQAAIGTAFAAKVDGARNLCRVLGSAMTGPMVLFSSVSAWLPPIGQVNYAAANAALDALARQLGQQGRAVHSIGLGPLAGSSMAALSAMAVRNDDGIAFLPSAMYVESIMSVLAAALPQALLVQFEPGMPTYDFDPLRRAMFQGVDAIAAATPAGTGQDRRQQFLACVGAILARDAATLDLARSLPSLGFDSLKVMELRANFRVQTGTDIAVGQLLRPKPLQQLLVDLGWGDAAVQQGDARPLASGRPPTMTELEL